MTENRDEINNGNGPDIKTRYEFLIAGLVVVVLCIVAFVTFRITSYINGAQVTDNTVSTLDMSDGTLLIEVEIKDSESDPSGDASAPSASDSDDAQATLNEHDDIEVFIYLDQDEKLIATTLKPLAKVGDFAWLECAWTNEYGAFLNWGLMKDLFCPFREQKQRMQKGQRYYVYVMEDEKTHRLIYLS